MGTIPPSEFGVILQLLSGASSSGTDSRRIMLDTPLSNFGVTVTMASSQAGLTAAVLYGAASRSTAITSAQATALVTWSTNTGLTVWGTTTARRRPVGQIWASVTDAATSAAASIDLWVAAVP